MSDKKGLLSAALTLFGAVCCLLYPLAIFWPSGWAWHQGGPAANDYFLMIVGLYATLGVFLLRAARNPIAHVSLIWFTIWSSVVHAAVMAAEAVRAPMHHGHLYGDVPALVLMAAVLGFLMLKAAPERASGDQAG
jgi:hypothetical protein